MTKNVLKMKIAVPTKDDEQIADLFENFEFYTIFNISDDNEIMAETILETPNDGNCEFQIANDLAEMGVNIMLVGHINDLMTRELATYKIHLVCNCEGNIYELIEKYLAS
jgi:predicted Fe-Mo cluster-binding NifX family protein